VTNFRRQMLLKVFMLFDLGVLATSFVVTSIEIWHLNAIDPFAAFISMRISVLNVLLFLALFYSWHIIFSACGLYGSKRLGNKKAELFEVLKAAAAAAAALAVVAPIFQVRMITPSFVVVFWAITSLALVLFRLLMRAFVASIRRYGHNLRHILIVGTNPRAEAFALTIAGRPELGYQLIGFADEAWEGNRDFEKPGRSLVTGLDNFSDFLRKHVVDEVVIALPMKSYYAQAARIVSDCQEQGVIVRGLASLFDFRQGRMDATGLDVAEVLTYSNPLAEGPPLLFKRLLDMIAASALLILSAPLLLLVALLIKLDSPGSPFFVQERVGLNKRKFRMYKFRTMTANAEKLQLGLEQLNEADGPVFKIKQDPRITRVGKYLRKTSIDEIPQLFNVLTGDMSLVGPRPLPLRDYQGFDQDWIHRRFSVRPGITCLWQVNGRSSTTFGRWMELDMQYIDNWSLWLDVKILAKTLPAVLAGRGAA
jgi:exopolysaccharide biosynthesis polyprenyl glycosylphosphotransferase